jgi:hypothetical protein
MYSKRVFSNNNNINFIDYNNIKKGEEIYKNIHSKDNCVNDKNYLIKDNELKRILDYDTFLNLSRTYFRHSRHSRTTIHNNSPRSINDEARSFICYNKILSHINDCDYCCNCKDIDKICECKEIKNILYPYDSYIKSDKNLDQYDDTGFSFPVKLKFQNCNNTNCDNKKIPVPSELSYCSKEKNEFSKYFNNYYGNCCEKNCHGNCSEKKPSYCINNIYPSQHQFMYYKSGCNIYNDYDEKKRMNDFAKYPQIGEYSKTFTNFPKIDCCKNRKPLFICK